MDKKKELAVRILVPILITCGIFLYLHLANSDSSGVPKTDEIYSFNIAYEVYNGEIIYLDNPFYENTPNKLLIRGADGKVSECGIENVDSFVVDGQYIYAQCIENTLCMFDLENKTMKHTWSFGVESFKGVDLKDFSGLKLMCADSKGAYFVADDGKAIGIYQATPGGKLNDVIVFPNMAGDIERMTISEKYLAFGYDGNEVDSGTYVYDFNKNSVERVSTVVGEEETELLPTFIWEDCYLVPFDYDLHIISLDGNENKKVDMLYGNMNMYLDENWLYSGSYTGLYKYNLKTGEVKMYKDFSRCVGTMKVYDNNLYLGYVAENEDGTREPRFVIKLLKSFMWDDDSYNIFSS